MTEIQKKILPKKELGQFFSGSSVATLLAHLAKSSVANDIIDPMCGTGDLLSACLDKKNSQKHLTGIELDEDVYDVAVDKIGDLSSVKLIRENAFSTNVLTDLLPQGYDLVITNPPYVRYQTFSGIETYFPSPSKMNEIRSNLIKYLDYFETVDDEDKRLFEILIKSFSGLSDLAVPSWILSSLLVKEGGRIAMVAPETWMSRDYALIIKYLLLRWFKIEYIIEDANSMWFHPVQVKTTLIVAKRIKRKGSFMKWANEDFTYAAIYSPAMTKNSLVGNVFRTNVSPELEFINSINKKEIKNDFYTSQHISIKHFSNDLKTVASTQKWLKHFEPEYSDVKLISNGIKISSELKNWYKDSGIRFCHLHDIGVYVSQGLRTGANFFFYLNYKVHNSDDFTVIPGEIYNLPPFIINKKYFRAVVRKQSELDDSFSLNRFISNGVVLDLSHFALPEDVAIIEKYSVEFKNKYHTIPEPLSQYIRAASTLKVGKQPTARLISDLSAVKPNIKLWNDKKDSETPKFWYMLPKFTRRHYPDLFIPRVNSSAAKTRLNENGKYLIDANFSTLWIFDKKSPYDNYSLLALLNSTWSVIAMEEYGTVMGGGALKLEATQLKKVPLPDLSEKIIKKLSFLGKELAISGSNADTLIYQIDCAIIQAFSFTAEVSEKFNELQGIKERLLKKRLHK